MSTEETHVTVKGWIWRGLLALVGCMVAAYVFEEVTGGGALGWTVMGAILGLFCWPLAKPLLERNRRRYGKKP